MLSGELDLIRMIRFYFRYVLYFVLFRLDPPAAVMSIDWVACRGVDNLFQNVLACDNCSTPCGY